MTSWKPELGETIVLGGTTYRVDAIAAREPTADDQVDLGPIPPGGFVTVLELVEVPRGTAVRESAE